MYVCTIMMDVVRVMYVHYDIDGVHQADCIDSHHGSDRLLRSSSACHHPHQRQSGNYVCMYVCMYANNVSLSCSVYICSSLHIVCMYAHVHFSSNIYVCMYASAVRCIECVCMYVCIRCLLLSMYLYVCMYVCMYVAYYYCRFRYSVHIALLNALYACSCLD